MEKSLISVIVPIYNVEKYLGECLDSIVNQTYKNLEIILVDDGSTDSSGSICDEYEKKDQRIKVVHKKNGGLSSARNVGLDVCSGRYVTFIDSDDWLELDTYEIAYEMLINYKADIVSYRFFNDYKNEKIFEKFFNETCLYDNKIVETVYPNANYSTVVWNKFYKKELFKTLRFSFNSVFEDWELYLPLLEACNRVVILPNLQYHYRQRKSSTVNNHIFDERYLLLPQFAEQREKYISNKYPNLISKTRIDVLSSYFVVAEKITQSSNSSDYIAILKETQSKMRKNLFEILTAPNMDDIFKSKYIVLAFNSKIYHYLLNKRRHNRVYYD